MREITVSANIRAQLAQREIPHSEIADIVGLSAQAMSRRMCGEVSFRDDELIKIAKHLKIDVAALFAKKSA